MSPVTERVLIVEDDAAVRRMLERSLGAEGFEISGAADGGAANVHAFTPSAEYLQSFNRILHPVGL